MRVVYLIAGAGGMSCGSCLRDNRLVATLIKQGRDVVLVPLYTPIRTDEADVSERDVYYGGINVYLQQRFGLFRRLPTWTTRALDSVPLLRWAGRFAGGTSAELLGPMTVSMLKGEEGAQRKELDRLIEGLRPLEPDVINLPNLMFVGIAARLKAELGVRVLCTLSGEDIFLDPLPERYRREAHDLIREGARDVDAFIAPTEYFASFATRRFELPAQHVRVVRLGIATDDVGEAADPQGEPFTIGYLARICPEKGLANLADAFIQLRGAGHNCRLRVAGYLGASDQAYMDRVCDKLRDAGVFDAFDYVREPDRAEKLDFLRSLHVLSVPTEYHEAKGLYVLEAMACGVPVVQPRHGSFPELVEATGGGLLYDPTEADALAGAIAGLMDDSHRRRDLADRGRRSVLDSFTDEIMARNTWALYERYGSE